MTLSRRAQAGRGESRADVVSRAERRRSHPGASDPVLRFRATTVRSGGGRSARRLPV